MSTQESLFVQIMTIMFPTFLILHVSGRRGMIENGRMENILGIAHMVHTRYIYNIKLDQRKVVKMWNGVT
jgi:hypothetical protein